MAHVHIALVGGQPAPVYNTLFYNRAKSEIDTIVLFCSQQSEKDAKQMQQNFTSITSDVRMIVCSASNIVKINRAIKGLFDSIAETDKVTIDITGGSKLWGLRIYTTFRERPNTQFLFTTQQNDVWDIEECTKSPLGFDPTFYQPLYSKDLELGTSIFEYTDADTEVMKKVEALRTEGFIPSFNQLTFDFSKHPEWKNKVREKSATFTLDNGSYIEWKRADPEGGNETAKIVLCNKTGRKVSAELSSPHALSILFNSGWFEYKVAHILERWEAAKNIWLNSKIKLESGSHDLNEIDVIVNTGHKRLYVECKIVISNTTDIDKFKTVYTANGGTSAKALFIVKEKISKEAREKCEKYGIMCYSLKENNDDTEKLFKQLDIYMQSTNK